MSIELPDSMFANANPTPVVPPPDPQVAREQAIADSTRAEEALNGFLAAQQHAMFEAPDAFYRTQGSDAIHAAPGIGDTLSKLRDDALARLANDAQCNKLGSALDAHLQLARDDIARHVAEQSLAWQRKTAQDRVALLTKEAAYHHNDNGRLDALGAAAANAARAHARVGDTPLDQEAEDAGAATARSGVLGSAIQARLNRGDTEGANALFTRVGGQLDPEHATRLQQLIDAGLVRVLPYSSSPESSIIEATQLPYRPPQNGELDNALIVKNLANVREDESARGQNGSGVVPVNATPADAIGAAKAEPQLAQAPSVSSPTASSLPPSARLPISENELDTAKAHIAQKAYEAKAELDTLAGTPRTADDNKYKGPLPTDWEKKLPAATLKKLNESAAEYGVPRNLIAAILWEESDFKEKASAGPRAEGQGMAGMSLGAQQDLITKAQRERNTERESELKTFDRMKGPAAVSMAAEYLKQLYDDNGQHWPSAVLAYRLGRTAVHNWLSGTSDDVKKSSQWDLSEAYIRKIFQGRSHLFDIEDGPEYP